MNRVLIVVGVAVALGFGLGVVSTGWPSAAAEPSVPASVPAPGTPEYVVASGRIESASEEIEVQSKLVGRLKSVLVDEGDAVVAGQPIAELDADDILAAVRTADAHVAMADAELERLVAGARPEERREADAAVTQAEAARQHLERDRERTRALFNAGALAASDMDRAERDVAIAAAREQELRERAAVVRAPPRTDERARAEAAVRAARAQLQQARAFAADTVIRAPIAGRVVRRHRQGGESVSPEQPLSIVTLAGDGPLRVRVEVDERDVARVARDQAVFVTADAYGDKKFPGKVLRVGERLGRKRIVTDNPSERSDTAVLEAIVALEPGTRLPLELRVTAYIEAPARPER